MANFTVHPLTDAPIEGTYVNVMNIHIKRERME